MIIDFSGGAAVDENEKNRLEKLEKQKRKQLDRQNKYINDNYDRIGIVVPKGQKAIIENRSKEKGFKNITEYIRYLIENDIKQDGSPDGSQENNFLPFG